MIGAIILKCYFNKCGTNDMSRMAATHYYCCSETAENQPIINPIELPLFSFPCFRPEYWYEPWSTSQEDSHDDAEDNDDDDDD